MNVSRCPIEWRAETEVLVCDMIVIRKIPMSQPVKIPENILTDAFYYTYSSVKCDE